jgi:hypothetical protein
MVRAVPAGLLAVLAAVLLAAAAWAARPRTLEPFGGETIFVSVASYRDAECLATLRSLFDSAADPKRVFVGVCEQNSAAAEELCLPAGFEHHDRVRRIGLPHGEALGPTYARYLCSTLYRDETYFCQVDSHTRFAEGWDAKAIAMMARCPSAKPVLTHYPHDFDQAGSGDGDGAARAQVPVLCKSRFDDNGLPTLEAVTMDASEDPRPVPFTSGGFVFGPGAMLREVPYDPGLPHLFQGEEITYSARLWTAGFSFFTPTENLVFHRYGRESAPKFWNDVDFSDTQRRTAAKVRKLLRGELPGYAYGMGTARSLEDYWKFAGIDIKKKTSQSEARFCR